MREVVSRAIGPSLKSPPAYSSRHAHPSTTIIAAKPLKSDPFVEI
jgi:hypothetical protein